MNAAHLIGGMGLFLFGIHLLTEGLKGLAGDGLRRVLQTLVAGRWSGLATGAVLTATIQSSSAATLAVIGFVSAGLMTFPQAVAVVFGANLGTTATSWLVALLGFKLSIAQAALPMVGVGVFVRLLAGGRRAAAGTMVAGFGLLFLGIGYLQTGMGAGGWDLSRWAGAGPAAPWLLAGVGLVMTVIMQSSSAAAATTLVALHTGTLAFDQACAMIIGQGIGTTVTAAFTMPTGGTSVRRTALAHILFNVITGMVVMVVLRPFSGAAAWLAGWVGDDRGVVALAAFHTCYKLTGIALLFPLLGPFCRLIERLIRARGAAAIHGLSPTLARVGGPVAVEAAWRAALEVSGSACAALAAVLEGKPPTSRDRAECLAQITGFLDELRPGSERDDAGLRGRVTMLWRTMDHLERLEKSLAAPQPIQADGPENGLAETAAARQALARWQEEVRARITPPAPPPESLPDFAKASADMAAHRRNQRVRLLEMVATDALSPDCAREALGRLLWTDQALYHAWRAADSLIACAAKDPPQKDN
ncbi:MAG: Na/Pi symporter [Akkermansiaceae bacterium]|jgi:phosphate:Na+ symporter|nr:Na/Pi symporter [Akkermansiaceae bacterium]